LKKKVIGLGNFPIMVGGCLHQKMLTKD